MLMKQKIKEVHEEMFEEMNKVANKHGLTVEQLGTLVSNDTGWNLRLRVETIKTPEEQYEHDKKLFEEMALKYGFDSSGFYKEVNIQGQDFRIVGYEPKRKKEPFTLESVADSSILKKADLDWYLRWV